MPGAFLAFVYVEALAFMVALGSIVALRASVC